MYHRGKERWREGMEAEEMVKLASSIWRKSFSGCRDIREDLVSEGVLGIVQAERNYDASRGLSRVAYACVIAKLRMLNYYNKEKKKRENIRELGDYDIADESAGLMFSEMEKDNKMEIVLEIVERFGDKDRQLIYGLLEGKTQAEMAVEMGASRQAINLRWIKCKKNIRNEYEKRSSRNVR